MRTEINSCTVDYSIYSTQFFYVVFFWFDVSLQLSTVAWKRKLGQVSRLETILQCFWNTMVTLHLFEFVENMIKTKAFTVCQNRGFHVESGITSTAGQNQKWREKIRGYGKLMPKSSCFSMINIIQILCLETIHIHTVLEPLPKFLFQRTTCK